MTSQMGVHFIEFIQIQHVTFHLNSLTAVALAKKKHVDWFSVIHFSTNFIKF